MQPGPEIVVQASDLGLTFQTNDGPVQALSDVDLTIGKGEFVSFIGPSGCGKTTFLRVIADLEKPTSGTISVNGMTPERGAREARLWLCVPGAGAVIPGAPSSATSRCRWRSWAMPGPSRRSAIARTLDLVNLSGFENKYPWQLSGGMQQRASIARALAFDADLLLMDEPFGALDEIVRDHLNEQLLELWARTNKTICFVTHSIPEAVYLSTRIVVMSPRPGPRHRHHRIDAAEASGRSTSARRRNSWRSPRACATACGPGTAMSEADRTAPGRRHMVRPQPARRPDRRRARDLE